MDSSGLDAESIMATVGGLVSTWGLKVVGGIAVLVIGLMVAKMIRGAARKAFARAEIDSTLVPFLSGIIYYLVLGCVLIAVMGMFGIETTSFIAVLGAAGLAVGLALQGTLSNFAAGVMILIFRPFGVGDFVDAGGQAGTVKEVGVFSTTMATGDNVKVIVPNSTIFSGTIKNFSANDTRRNDMVIGVGYGDDLQLAMDTIHKVIGSDDRVLADPAPTVAVSELADSSVNFVVRPWCKKEDYWGLRFDLTRRFKEELEAAGCSIPYPQQDVHMHQVASSAA
jgi:small conductance mechanosensitive channel